MLQTAFLLPVFQLFPCGSARQLEAPHMERVRGNFPFTGSWVVNYFVNSCMVTLHVTCLCFLEGKAYETDLAKTCALLSQILTCSNLPMC